jgi:hypothetical protein
MFLEKISPKRSKLTAAEAGDDEIGFSSNARCRPKTLARPPPKRRRRVLLDLAL